MRIVGLLAGLAALALTLGPAVVAGADTCNPVYGNDVDCNAKAAHGGGAAQNAPPAPTVKAVGPSRGKQLKPTPAEQQAIADRINNAVQRMNEIADKAGGVTDPAMQAELRKQYEAATADLRRAIGDAEAATTDAGQRAQQDDYYKRTVQSFNDRLVAAELYSSAPPDAPPPKRQNGLAESLRRNMAPDEASSPTRAARVQCRDAAGGFVKDCYFTLEGGRCLKQTLGTNGWDYAELPTDQCPADVKQAYCQAYPRDGLCPQAKPVAKADTPAQPAPGGAAGDAAPVGSKPFIISEEEVRAAMGKDPEEALLAQLPAECVPKFKQYLADVGDSHGNAAQDPAHAADATNSYQALDASRECRDAIRRIADANTLELPARHLNPRTRTAFATALAADPSASLPRQAAPIELQDDGYNPQEVLEFGFALLNLASGAANLAHAMHGGGGFSPSAMGGAVRSLAPRPQAGHANYPAPAAPVRTQNCTINPYDNWLTCK
jgi:hypothetical protein